MLASYDNNIAIKEPCICNEIVKLHVQEMSILANYKPKCCPICGTTFRPLYAREKYCCDKCKTVAYQHQQDKHRSPYATRKCEWCGETFQPKNNTQKYCNGTHYSNCEICGKLFMIDVHKQDKPRTCSKECSYKLRFQNGNPLSNPQYREKAKQTCLLRYGAEYPMQNKEIAAKVKSTYFDRTGYSSPVHNPETRRAILGGHSSKLEDRICQLLSQYNIQFIQHYFLEDAQTSHEYDFYLPEYKLLIDADGQYYHSYLEDPDGKHVLDYYDEDRLHLIPEGYKFHVIVEGQEDKDIAKLYAMLSSQTTLNEYDTDIFNWCRKISFPFPKYSEDRLKKTYESLKKYASDKYVPQARIGDCIINHFHRSVYFANVKGYDSPYEAWYDDDKLKKVIKNRLIYMNDVDPSKILRGFNISKICPRVSVFNPILAKYITEKYLNEFNMVFDPFSGFSGRMLGVCASGKIYVGHDLNESAVKESNEIISLLSLTAYVDVQDCLESSGEYDCILTCPPYSDKEQYNDETVHKTCDEWIDYILEHFKCRRYAFVVDNTSKYESNIVEEISSTSHLNKVKEYIIIVDRDEI